MTIDNLNVYQLIEIFEFLTLEERLVCSRVCRKFRSAINFLGIQQLTVFYLAEPDHRRAARSLVDHSTNARTQQINGQDDQQANRKGERPDKEDKRFTVYIQTDRLLGQLGNPLFRKLKTLNIHANSSLQLADSYIDLKQLESLESLQIDNRSLCLCLNMCLERDSIRLENLKYLTCHRINLKLLLKHCPNLVVIKCCQVDCYDPVRMDEWAGERRTEAQEMEAGRANKSDQINESLIRRTATESKQIKWKHFELNSLRTEISEYFFDFLVENCPLLEELKINVSDLDEIILLLENLRCLKRLKFNCRTSESAQFEEKLKELVRLVIDRNSKGRQLKVEFNGLELVKGDGESNETGANLSSHRLKKFLLIKSEFHTLNYYDLIKIDQLCRDLDLEASTDLVSLFPWCQVMHVNQNLDNLRILSLDHLDFLNVRQLFFKAFDYDETVNDQQLRMLFAKLPNLRSIDLSCVQRLKQETLDCIADGCARLNELNLSSNRSRSICLKFLARLEQLERAEFYACKFDESTVLNELTRDLKYFTYLSITNCDNLIGVEEIFLTMYDKATNNRRLEYNLYIHDKPYSQLIYQKFGNNDRFPQMRNFFFID